MKHSKEFFTSRLGFIISLIGIAIGAGNIWRFSRIVAQNGGGTFLIPWSIFLLIWSIPLIISELAMGKMTRKAPIGAITQTAGRSFGWMGAFIALVTTGIMFYYSVVVGWGFRYFGYALTGTLSKTADYPALWESFSHSWQPLVTHLFSMLIGGYVIYKGVQGGIEKGSKILIPGLILMILALAIRALTLPGAIDGVKYLFTPRLSDLLNANIWIEGLTQNAWDTGAGWGLLMVYANYARQSESVNSNGIITALINNGISLIMGILIFGAAFALAAQTGAASDVGDASAVGLTFVYLPQLFFSLPGGPFVQSLFAAFFFLAFALGALSSMIAMLKVAVKSLHELGIPYKKALVLVTLLGIALGAPSAISMAIFDNQDIVWSLGLVVNGLFIAFAISRYGVERFRKEQVNNVEGDYKVGKFYSFCIKVLVPCQAIALLAWYFYRAFAEGGLNPFHVYSLGSLLMQWGIALVFFIAINKWLVEKAEVDTITN